MSETGRKMDVEDVLSSIRRLVSEEARTDVPADEPAPRTAPPEAAAKPPEKLVLTPSLRVPDAEPPVPTSEIERRISDIEELVNSGAQAAAPRWTTRQEEEERLRDTPASGPRQSADVSYMFDTGADEFTYGSAPADAEPEQQPAPVLQVSALDLPEEDFQARLKGRTPPHVVARPETKPEAQPETQPEAPGHRPGPQPADMSPPAPEPAQNAGQNAGQNVTPDAGRQGDDAPRSATISPRDPATQRGHAAAWASPADAESDGQPGPRQDPPLRAGPDSAAPLTPADDPRMDQGPDAAAQATAKATPEAPEKAPAAAPHEDRVDYTAEEDGAFVDEEMLREIVSEMVRSELQGELGDRITRNVRKLVRREIHRALASRDFE